VALSINGVPVRMYGLVQPSQFCGNDCPGAARATKAICIAPWRRQALQEVAALELARMGEFVSSPGAVGGIFVESHLHAVSLSVGIARRLRRPPLVFSVTLLNALHTYRCASEPGLYLTDFPG
jgi:hypothetical protein